MPQTRKAERCPIFGSPAEMSESQLPTFSDIMKSYLLLRNRLKSTQTGENTKEPTVSELSEMLSRKVEQIWHKASLPIISHKQTVAKIRSYHDKYRTLLKPFKGRKANTNYNAKITKFASDARSQLFDICSCKCTDYNNCKCKKEQKVPAAEREFLTDQRGIRQMVIGGVDSVLTAKMQRKIKRKNSIAAYAQKHVTSAPETTIEPDSSEDDTVSVESGAYAHDNDIFMDNKSSDRELVHCRTTQESISLPNVARVCDRYGVSDRCAASIVTATLQDVGLVTATDTSLVIDRSKLRRSRKKIRKSLKSEMCDAVKGLYFDGRKDHTRTQIKKGKKYYNRTITEEHVCLVGEPNSTYLGHISPTSGEAKSIAGGVISFFADNKVSIADLVAVGCDGTNVNTGAIGGVIRLLEEYLSRPLQWFICLLHANELPLRHLLQKLDGATSGPKAFLGPIGKALVGCEELPIVKFQCITFENCPVVDALDLSNDQRYLYDICCAVSTGICPDDLASKKPGPVVHSRWLTTASRLLRLYVSTIEPSDSLVELTTYVVKVYASVWFNVKAASSCSEGSRHVWRLIHYSRYLKPSLRKVVDEVIQRNAYFCHTENLLLAMMTDERKHVRELACRRMLAAREVRLSTGRIRQFRVPKVNFNAKDYIDLVDWTSVEKSEPPIMRHVTREQLREYVNNPATSQTIDFPKFPCHTQATERCIRLVTEASAAVCGYEQRDGFIRARIDSRQKMKTFDTKCEYVV